MKKSLLLLSLAILTIYACTCVSAVSFNPGPLDEECVEAGIEMGVGANVAGVLLLRLIVLMVSVNKSAKPIVTIKNVAMTDAGASVENVPMPHPIA